MKLRPIQLVCLALLLAALRMADPAALAPSDLALRAGVLNVLLRTELTSEWTEPASSPRPESRIPAPALRVVRKLSAPRISAPGSMPPPALQSAAVQSHTSFLRA